MLIVQFQISSIDKKEYDLIPEFCKFLTDKMFTEINTRLNRRKVELRLKHIYKVPWIKWNSSKYLDVNDIMETIRDSFTSKEYKDNIWKIEINNSVKIPKTQTSISRLIRFLDYGDYKTQPMGIFTKIENEYRGGQLMSLWRLFILNELGYLSNSRIVTR